LVSSLGCEFWILFHWRFGLIRETIAYYRSSLFFTTQIVMSNPAQLFDLPRPLISPCIMRVRCTKWVLQHGRLEDFLVASGLEVTEAAAQIAHFTQPAVHALVSATLL
jgi:hypothetical protein